MNRQFSINLIFSLYVGNLHVINKINNNRQVRDYNQRKQANKN